jgi:hypothetical protein
MCLAKDTSIHTLVADSHSPQTQSSLQRFFLLANLDGNSRNVATSLHDDKKLTTMPHPTLAKTYMPLPTLTTGPEKLSILSATSLNCLSVLNLERWDEYP